MGAFDVLGIAGSSMAMHQSWLDCLSNNIANINTARPTSGPAFQAQYAMAAAVPGGGVRLSGSPDGPPPARVGYLRDTRRAYAKG
jgi:flagellar basal-body rod protein FlgC